MKSLNIISIVLAAALLLCLAPMPYGYYTLVRFVATAVFAFLAYDYYEKEGKATPMVFTFGALALLFQPFCKIALSRVIWNVVDVAVAIWLLYLWIKKLVEK